MSVEFDPYHEWLGIPPSEQPPNHYRLLGIVPFEEKPTVIQHAADRVMAHLRTFGTSKHTAESQRLLNEVANAKVCLLKTEKKAAYDQLLRELLASTEGEEGSGGLDIDFLTALSANEPHTANGKTVTSFAAQKLAPVRPPDPKCSGPHWNKGTSILGIVLSCLTAAMAAIGVLAWTLTKTASDEQNAGSPSTTSASNPTGSSPRLQPTPTAEPGPRQANSNSRSAESGETERMNRVASSSSPRTPDYHVEAVRGAVATITDDSNAPMGIPASSIVPDIKPDPGPIGRINLPVEPKENAKQVSLNGLASAVELAGNRDSTIAISLGELESAPNIDLGIRLVGGTTIAKGNPSFELVKETGGGKPAWSVMMEEKGRDDIAVARIFLDAGECKFQWTTDARERAILVRYCGLQFASGLERHFTALTAPKAVSPIVFDFDAGTYRPRRISLNFTLPDPSMLHMQIMPLNKLLTKHEIKVIDEGRPVRAARGKTPEITAGDTIAARGSALVMLNNDKTPPVTFQVAFDARGKDVTFNLEAACQVAGEVAPFNASELQRRAAGVASILALDGNSQRGRKPPPQAMVQVAKTASTDLTALNFLVGELHQQVVIPFCIYAVAGQAEDDTAPRIVIFQSEEDAAKKGTDSRVGTKR